MISLLIIGWEAATANRKSERSYSSVTSFRLSPPAPPSITGVTDEDFRGLKTYRFACFGEEENDGKWETPIWYSICGTSRRHMASYWVYCEAWLKPELSALQTTLARCYYYSFLLFRLSLSPSSAKANLKELNSFFPRGLPLVDLTEEVTTAVRALGELTNIALLVGLSAAAKGYLDKSSY